MATNNLRIIYNNVLDVSTVAITASSTASSATTTANLLVDAKSLVWRSTTTSASIIVSNFSSQIIGGVVFPFCNLTPTATIRVRGYTGVAPTISGTSITGGGSNVFDSGTILCCPYTGLGTIWNQAALPTGVNTYYFGGGTYGRVWIPVNSQIACTSVGIEIVDSANTAGYIEASRLILGSYWTPTYNTGFGLGTQMKDLSTQYRSEAGDLLTNRGPRFNSMSFDLQWMNPTDRWNLSKILSGNGLGRPMLISLFPDNSADWEREDAHQIYGKMVTLGAVTLPIFDMYSTKIDIEEI